MATADLYTDWASSDLLSYRMLRWICAAWAAVAIFFAVSAPASSQPDDPFRPPVCDVRQPDCAAAWEARRERERTEWEANRKKDEAQHKANEERTDRCIAGLNKLQIGMTEKEAGPIIDCARWRTNTTETAAGIREQVVLGNTPSRTFGYLYFENGRLVAIQRTTH